MIIKISPLSEKGRKIIDSSMIIFYEAPMTHKYLLEGLERTLNNLMDTPRGTFGG